MHVMEEQVLAHYGENYHRDWAIEAIRNRNQEEAERRVRKVWDGFMNLRNVILTVASGAFTHIAENEGEDAVYDTWKQLTKDLNMDKIAPALRDGHMTPKDWVLSAAETMLSHGGAFDVLEDEEKYTLYYNHCNVCSRMADSKMLDVQGGFIGTVKEAHSWARGGCGMPYYCVHAPIWFGEIGKEIGYDIFDFEFASTIDENGTFHYLPCREIVYKKPKKSCEK